jgi:Leucine Rich Repeat (LRR) protein
MRRRVCLGALTVLNLLATAALADGDDVVERIRKSSGGEILFGHRDGKLVPIEVRLNDARWKMRKDRGRGPGDDLLLEIATMPTLRFLSARYTTVTDRGVKACRKLVELRELDLSFSDIAGLSLRDLGPLAKLRLLSLASTPIGDDAVSSMALFPKLESLDLSHTGITDASLSRVGQYKSLVFLDMCGTHTGKSGFPFLSELGRLESFYASGTDCTDRVWPVSQIFFAPPLFSGI